MDWQLLKYLINTLILLSAAVINELVQRAVIRTCRPFARYSENAHEVIKGKLMETRVELKINGC